MCRRCHQRDDDEQWQETRVSSNGFHRVTFLFFLSTTFAMKTGEHRKKEEEEKPMRKQTNMAVLDVCMLGRAG